MVQRVEKFITEYDKTPSESDIRLCYKYANEHDCIVELAWTLKWSGRYSRLISKDCDIDGTIKEIKSIVYGL